MNSMLDSLIEKYNVSVPRYTSYPTVPMWQPEPPSVEDWIFTVESDFNDNKEISLYIHLPFCESMCTFCGCNKRITKNHGVELPYIELLIKEWNLYLSVLGEKPILKELHLGGGTPTFFSPENLKNLLTSIFETVIIPHDHNFGFEAHPSSTTVEHLSMLRALDFNRLSLGVQDFDEQILKVINRQQSKADIYNIIGAARKLNYSSINIDLVFGLPFQTLDNIEANMEHIKELRPDRIAYYSYAHVPWKSPSQRAYSIEDLPVENQKRQLYDRGKHLLESFGYEEIGLDHFALTTDELFLHQQKGKLNRNFMGYTTAQTKLNLAIGISSISETSAAYIQNEKHIKAYTERVNERELPFFRGHKLSGSDKARKQHIIDVMCHGTTKWTKCYNPFSSESKQALVRELIRDELIKLSEEQLTVTEKGRPFLRNICSLFDAYTDTVTSKQLLFSSSI